MTEQANMVEGIRQQVVGMVTEARNRLDKHAARAREIRAQVGLTAELKQMAVDEVVIEARTRVRALIRDARHGASGGFSIGDTGAAPYSPRSWITGLTPAQETIRTGMLSYIDSAERVFEAANPAPAGIAGPRSRWESGG